MNLLIENELQRLSANNIAITSILRNPVTGKHIMYSVDVKGKITSHELPEGTTVTINVTKSKQPNEKAA